MRSFLDIVFPGIENLYEYDLEDSNRIFIMFLKLRFTGYPSYSDQNMITHRKQKNY